MPWTPPGAPPEAAPRAHGGRPGGFRHRRTAKEAWRCKRAHRTDLAPNSWGRHGYAHRECAALGPELPAGGAPAGLALPRVRWGEVTAGEFFERFALPGRPCIIEGAMDGWPAMHRWGIDALLARCGHAELKVGEDDKGRKLRMKLKYFVDYMRHQQDDSPLYLFEGRMECEPVACQLLEDFSVPDAFPHDLFDLVNPDAKPPHRWWSIGPRRSGTTVHIDPLGTSAWNAVTHGRKRWVLFEPSVPKRLARGTDLIDKGREDDEAVMYFDFILPRIKWKHPDVRVYEAVQNPGEVIFVPSEWWHGALNLEDTVAVTQNYCGYDNFDLVWTRTRRDREKLAFLWLRNMRKFAPVLHARALQLNQRDGFRMRHQRAGGRLCQEGRAGSSSSSSEGVSSSDSSSDEESHLDLARVHRRPGGAQVVPPWLRRPAPPAGHGGTQPEERPGRAAAAEPGGPPPAGRPAGEPPPPWPGPQQLSARRAPARTPPTAPAQALATVPARPTAGLGAGQPPPAPAGERRPAGGGHALALQGPGGGCAARAGQDTSSADFLAWTGMAF